MALGKVTLSLQPLDGRGLRWWLSHRAAAAPTHQPLSLAGQHRSIGLGRIKEESVREGRKGGGKTFNGYIISYANHSGYIWT